MIKREDMLIPCAICNNYFKPRNKSSKFCTKFHRVNCVVCGKEFKSLSSVIFRGGNLIACSQECRVVKRKGTCSKLYGGIGFSSPTIKNKAISTNNIKYNCNYPLQSKDVRDKRDKTVKLKYGVDYICEANVIKEKVKHTNLSKFGTEKPFQNKNVQRKVRETLLTKYGGAYSVSNNGFLNDNAGIPRNKLEREIFYKLSKIFCEVYANYKSELYPFFCDFYIKDIDTYIELNFHPTHYIEPYDESKHKELKDKLLVKMESSKFYRNMYITFIESDPKKIKVAMQNKINLKSFL